MLGFFDDEAGYHNVLDRYRGRIGSIVSLSQANDHLVEEQCVLLVEDIMADVMEGIDA